MNEGLDAPRVRQLSGVQLVCDHRTERHDAAPRAHQNRRGEMVAVVSRIGTESEVDRMERLDMAVGPHGGMKYPWQMGILAEWSIVGMNHYHVGGERHLFVAMTNGDRCIKAEGKDDHYLWNRLWRKADEIARESSCTKGATCP